MSSVDKMACIRLALVACAVLTEPGSSLPGVAADSLAELELHRVRRDSRNGTDSASALQGLVDNFGTAGRISREQLQQLLQEIDVECFSAEELLQDHSLTEENLQSDPKATLREICPSLLYANAQDACQDQATTPTPSINDDETQEPTTAQIWGYGFLCVTIINCGSLMGAFVVPCMDKKICKLILTYMVGLAVGTLTGSALLHLIPKTHGLKVKKLGNELVWKNSCILAGIYIFFVAERILKIVTSKKDAKKETKRQDSIIRVSGMHHNKSSNGEYKITSGHSAMQLTDTMDSLVDKDERNEHSHGDLKTVDGEVRIRTVAYMIVCGDGLHNFVDGLAIGASFTSSLLSGFSTSIAIACEEFPHELGDFAVLLKSGLSVKRAMGFNFLSSLFCYVGLVIGIAVGRLTAAEPYIFALAAGMFLYIALVDMLPEISNVSSNKRKFRVGSELGIFLLQNAGILTGFGLMMLLSVLHPYIKIRA